MDYDLETVAALFLRANQKRVGGFVVVRCVIRRICLFIHDIYALELADWQQ